MGRNVDFPILFKQWPNTCNQACFSPAYHSELLAKNLGLGWTIPRFGEILRLPQHDKTTQDDKISLEYRILLDDVFYSATAEN